MGKSVIEQTRKLVAVKAMAGWALLSKLNINTEHDFVHILCNMDEAESFRSQAMPSENRAYSEQQWNIDKQQ